MADTIVRQAAFLPTGNNMLKGDLHAHTTRSDGKLRPKKVQQLHRDLGYDFLAITDHSRYNRKNHLPDSDLLIIPGMEMNCKWDINRGHRYFHAVSIGPDDQTNGFVHEEEDPYELLANPHAFQQHVDHARENNNLVIYCHPQWSQTPVRSFEFLDGIFAMEVFNSICSIDLGRDTDNGIYWDELLGQGRVIWGVASDDGHEQHHFGNGWVRVNAEKNIPAILKALKEGAFYASCGPEIHDFYVEDGIAHIACSPCRRVVFFCDKFNYPQQVSEDNTLTEATMDLRDAPYIRACVVDEHGRKAWTNPIFLDGR